MPAERQTKSFKKKVVRIFISISILPLLLLSAASLYLVIKTQQNNIIEYQTIALDNLSEKVTKYLNDKSESLNLVISTPIPSLDTMTPDIALYFLQNAFESKKPNSLDLIDLSGNIAAKIDKNAQVSFNRQYISKHETFASANGVASMADFMAENSIGSFSEIEGRVAGAPDFEAVMAGEEYFGPLEFADGKPVMRMASRIENSSKKIIGVISAEVSLVVVDSLASQVKIGQQGYVYVLDSQGRTVANGNNDSLSISQKIYNPEIQSPVAAGQEFGTGQYFTTVSNSGAGVVAAGKKIPLTGWYAIGEWPIQDAFAVIKTIVAVSLAILAIILIITFLLAIVFSRQIIRPIEALAGGAREISLGNLNHQIVLKTGDEFELLGGQFNEMINVLKENRKLRDEFVFIAAHELRTPVTAIKGYLSMVLEDSFGPVPDKIRENLNIVNASNNRLVQLVHDLLEVARSDAGKMQITMDKQMIVENVMTVVNELRSLSEQKGITVEYAKPEPDIAIMADGYKLKEVLTNLIGNAVKYTLDNGGIKIWHEQKDGFLFTHIQDHGIGLSKEELDKLFGKFFRAQNDKTRKIEGTGLGLFICKEIIQRMEGDIWAESEEGKGSVFSFKLKLIS